MSKAETLFREAFERLKTNTPINLPKGTKVSQNNIAKEAGKHPTALKKDRFPLLVLEIQDYIKQQEIDSDIINKKKQLRKQRTLEERLADCKKQRDKLASICEAQAQLIDDLRDQLSDCENGIKNPTNLNRI
ncbi:hypothetical protein [Thiomicrorhabdus sp.]|uniref:hypothetical protein n=1 Tax=Thiomicrorhabdus sp. TaxID=2039724 RepID=UPI002AA7E40D|nr:hypothetical protein [Thiomicrorhabdus sp.]